MLKTAENNPDVINTEVLNVCKTVGFDIVQIRYVTALFNNY